MGALMAFRVGQEVVCVDDRNRVDFFAAPMDSPELLKKGAIYTVACAPFKNIWGRYAIHLVERPGKEAHVGYACTRFRPIVKTDISIFEAMLAHSPKQRADADA